MRPPEPDRPSSPGPAAPTAVEKGSSTDRRRTLAVLIALGIASTVLHYGHNFVMAEMYPPVPPLFPTALSYRIGIAISLPLGTILVLWAYRQYVRGRLTSARWALVLYSPLGLTTPGHFAGGMPHIETWAMVTIFTDFATGLAILLFALVAIPWRGTRR